MRILSARGWCLFAMCGQLACVGSSTEIAPECGEPDSIESVEPQSQRIVGGTGKSVAQIYADIAARPVEVYVDEATGIENGTLELRTGDDVTVAHYDREECGPDILRIPDSFWEVRVDGVSLMTTDPGLFEVGPGIERLAQWSGTAGPAFADFHATVAEGSRLTVFEGCNFTREAPCGLTGGPTGGPLLEVAVPATAGGGR